MTGAGSTTRAVRLVVTGKVQGVWFRAWTAEKAGELKLDGWVRNRRDGSVEMLISGPEPAVEAMIAAARRGPPSARVSAVAMTTEPAPSEKGFAVRPTA